MKDTAKYFYLVLGLALVVAFGLAVRLLGGDRIMTLALILVVGLAVAGIAAAVSLPIRAWRKRDGVPIEKHVYHEGTKTVVRERVIDNRPAPLQLPAPQQPFGVFPELLRASYRAGILAQPGEVADAEVRELGASDDWQGDITQ